MYKHTIISPEGKTTINTISDQKFIELLVQLHLLKQCGGFEEIEICTNAKAENNYTWDKITVIRKVGNRGYTTAIFDKIN